MKQKFKLAFWTEKIISKSRTEHFLHYELATVNAKFLVYKIHLIKIKRSIKVFSKQITLSILYVVSIFISSIILTEQHEFLETRTDKREIYQA